MKKVDFISSLGTETLSKRTAYIKVQVGSKRQAQMVKSGVRKTWIKDSLLKVRTSQDLKSESFDNRTVIVSGIPKHLSSEKLLDYFARD